MRKMSCRRVRRLLSAYREGSLRPQSYARVASHLESCDECAATLASLGELSAALRRLPEPAMADERGAELLRAVRREMEKPVRRPRSLSYRIAAGAAIGLALVAVSSVSFSLLWQPEDVAEKARVPEAAAPAEGLGAEQGEDAAFGTLETSEPEPLVMTGGRELDADDLGRYTADYGQRLAFYTYFWERGGAWRGRPLPELQAEYVAAMGQAAAALGEDPASLAASLWLSMQAAGSDAVLPCYAEKVFYDGRAAWLVSLSGPADVALFAEQAANSKEQAVPKMMYIIDAAAFEVLY